MGNYVQSVLVSDVTGVATSISATLNGVGANHALVVMVNIGNVTSPGNNLATYTLSVSDSQCNTYSIAAGPDLGNYNGQNVNEQLLQIWVNTLNTISGNVTVTVKFTVSGSPAVAQAILVIAEYDHAMAKDVTAFGYRNVQGGGHGTSTGLDSSVANDSDGSGGTPATNHANEVWIGWGGDLTGDPSTYTAGAGYTIRQQFSTTGGDQASAAFEDKAVSTLGNAQAGMTSSLPTEWIMTVTTFFDTTLSGTAGCGGPVASATVLTADINPQQALSTVHLTATVT